MIAPLLRSRRFLPLFVTQFLGALNDNLFKNALVVLALFQAGAQGPVLVAAAGGVFILPYVLFASIAGELADRYDKARLIRLMKWWECALMVTAAVGFLSGEIGFLMVVLFGLGVQATFFSPLKYGILPDHLGVDEIVAGNGYIEAGTYVGILVGTIAGAALIRDAEGPLIVSIAGLAVALAGLLCRLGDPAGAAVWRARRHRLEPGARDLAHPGACAAQPGDLARGAGDLVVLDGRAGAADAVPGGGEGRARRRRGAGDAAADRVHRGGRGGLRPVPGPAARRGVGAPRAVGGVRHFAVHLGLRRRLPGGGGGGGDQHPGGAGEPGRVAHAGRPVRAGVLRRGVLGAALCDRAGARGAGRSGRG